MIELEEKDLHEKLDEANQAGYDHGFAEGDEVGYQRGCDEGYAQAREEAREAVVGLLDLTEPDHPLRRWLNRG